jgi:hypothetical protein
MVHRIHTSVKTPELRRLLLKIVSDQRITEVAREGITGYLTGKRTKKKRLRIWEWIQNVFS